MAQPHNIALISACVFLEQFGYGFGFTAYMLFLMYFCEGSHKTSHYAICTGFMALSMMIPGFWAGALQERIGYVKFFWWVMLCCIATIAVAMIVKVDPNYGKAQPKAQPAPKENTSNE
jgi:PAT family beta-lactamase induction signal transducer AmpG